MRELSNPNLHDIANMSYRVELWERHADHIRWTIAASGSIGLAHAAFDAAVKELPNERFTLRQEIMTMREYPERSGRGSVAAEAAEIRIPKGRAAGGRNAERYVRSEYLQRH